MAAEREQLQAYVSSLQEAALTEMQAALARPYLSQEEVDSLLQKHGAVAEVKIPRKGEPEVGLCFVRFEQVQASVLAKDALHNRQFDGNTVIATFVDDAVVSAAMACTISLRESCPSPSVSSAAINSSIWFVVRGLSSS